MKISICTLILAVVFALVMYLLYRGGIAVTKCLAAALFVFRKSKNSYKVSVRSCTGWVRHALPLREDRTWEFYFDTQLAKGDVQVSLLDSGRQEFLRLTPYLPAGSVTLNKGGRYYLRWEFKNADGKFLLSWH